MHISELSKILKKYFYFHKSRSDCFAHFIIALITVKTVNFTNLATVFTTKARSQSSYKRIQRFFQFLKLDY